jgi:peptidoglycan/LPS O-acetylase OafA/YrhL
MDCYCPGGNEMNSTVLPAGPLDTSVPHPDANTLAGEPVVAERFYRPELDGLRFFAFLAVYVEHTFGFGMGEHHHLPNWIGTALGTIGKAGTFGVDLFFVLSSYLITELLLRERKAVGHLDVKRFYIRRILRIWPL